MKNISKIISIFFLSFSILLLCYVFYRSQIVHHGLNSEYYLKYYVIASLSIILSFISFFIPKNLKINITIVGISLFIGLYLVEGYLIIKNKDDRFIIYKNNTGKDYDKRDRYQIYQDLKKENSNIVLTIYPSVFLFDKNLIYFPLSGLSNRKTIHCNENGYYSIYQSDRYGFNNPDEEWDKDEIDFLLVGDSFTHGACVNEPDTISGNLRRLSNNKNGILNLGQGGSSSLIEYASLREYLPVKQVKRVLWIYFENDITGLHFELRNQILIRYLKDKSFSQDVIFRKQEIQKLLLQKFEETKVIQNKFPIFFRFIKLFSVREIIFPAPIPIPATKEFKNILKLSNEFTTQNNSKLYFVYLPQRERYLDKNNNDNFMHYKKVIQIVEDLGIPIIDINKKLFEKHNDSLSLFPFRKFAHYTEKGYHLVAKTIFNTIKELEK